MEAKTEKARDEMENKGAFQGDMMLTPKQMEQMKKGKLSFGSNKDGMWPTTIPYEFESGK